MNIAVKRTEFLSMVEAGKAQGKTGGVVLLVVIGVIILLSGFSRRAQSHRGAYFHDDVGHD